MKFFVRLLVFLYSTVVNSELGGLMIFVNRIQTLTSEVGDSIQKDPGPEGGSPVRGVGGNRSPSQKRGI